MSDSDTNAKLRDLERLVQETQRELRELRALYAYENFGSPAKQPPLDSSVIWKRGRDESEPEGTHQILSLIFEENAETSWPWPLLVELTTKHNAGEAVGITAKLMNDGRGWGAAYHAETFHDGGEASTIGVNVEAHRKADTGRSIAVNLQSVPWQREGSVRDTTINEAINVQSQDRTQWATGLHFDQGSRGTRAIWIEGTWEVGIDVGNSRIRMNKGAELCFDETGRFYMKYNPDTNSIEFHNRTSAAEDKVIFSIPGDPT